MEVFLYIDAVMTYEYLNFVAPTLWMDSVSVSMSCGFH